MGAKMASGGTHDAVGDHNSFGWMMRWEARASRIRIICISSYSSRRDELPRYLGRQEKLQACSVITGRVTKAFGPLQALVHDTYVHHYTRNGELAMFRKLPWVLESLSKKTLALSASTRKYPPVSF